MRIKPAKIQNEQVMFNAYTCEKQQKFKRQKITQTKNIAQMEKIKIQKDTVNKKNSE